MRMRALALATTLTAAGLAGAAPPVVAAERGAPAGSPGFVTAESHYGNGTVRGPVRRTAQGRLEVRLPGGTWLECGRSCSDTLRRETVDFWKERGAPRQGGDGPGYLQRKF